MLSCALLYEPEVFSFPPLSRHGGGGCDLHRQGAAQCHEHLQSEAQGTENGRRSPPPQQPNQTFDHLFIVPWIVFLCHGLYLVKKGCTSSYRSCSESDHTHTGTIVIQVVYPEVRSESPLPYFRANLQDLFSSWELARINFIFFLEKPLLLFTDKP